MGAQHRIESAASQPYIFEKNTVYVRGIIPDRLGLFYCQKRQNVLQPVPITGRDLSWAFGIHSTADVENSVTHLMQFLKYYPVGDKFGEDNVLRKAEREASIRYLMNDKNGKDIADKFLAFYYTHNQFVKGVLSNVIMDITFLSIVAQRAHNFDLAKKLHQIDENIRAKLEGCDPESNTSLGLPYNKIVYTKDKLVIVHYIEDKVIEALNCLC